MAAAAVSVGTYSAWENTATSRLLGSARRGRRGAGHIVSPRAQLVSCTEWKRFEILHLIVPAKPIRNRYWFHSSIECVLSMSGVAAVYWYSPDGGTICCWPRSSILRWLQRSTNHLLISTGIQIWRIIRPPNNSPNLNARGDILIMSGERHTKLFSNLHSPKSFWIKNCTRRYWTVFCRFT